MSFNPTRRDTLRALAASAASASAFRAARAQGDDRPDIVVILSDNHRADYLSVAGHPFVETPALDRLAEEGVYFDSSFVTTPLCSPSRACFLTGTYAHKHGIKNNLTPWRGQRPLFLQALAEAGYDVGFIGKWHMPGEGLPDLPFLQRFVSFTAQGGQGRYFNCPLIVDGAETASAVEYIAEELTNHAISFIEQPRQRPFCLYLSHKSVHHPYQPPRDLAGLYADQRIEAPDRYDPWLSMTNGRLYSGTMGLLDVHQRNYCEAIVGMDRAIGRLLSHIDARDRSRRTAVIYTSDNGMLWGEHRRIDMNWPYEESLRVPLIARFPGRFPAGRRTSAMALNIDLAPTLLDMAGVSGPEDLDGQSLLPVFEDPARPGREDFLFEYFKDYPYNMPSYQGVRTRTHKYVEYQGRMKNLLFDLVADPRESHNLYGQPEGRSDQARLAQRLVELRRMHGLG